MFVDIHKTTDSIESRLTTGLKEQIENEISTESRHLAAVVRKLLCYGFRIFLDLLLFPRLGTAQNSVNQISNKGLPVRHGVGAETAWKCLEKENTF